MIRQGKRRVLNIVARQFFRGKNTQRYGNLENTDHIVLSEFLAYR
jgi:hypothetical protein